MVFKDRMSAAYHLVDKLSEFRGQNPIILAIPPGGVPMAYAVMNSIGGDLDVVLVAEFSSPLNPDISLGAVTEFGDIYLGHESRQDIESSHSELLGGKSLESIAAPVVNYLKKKRQEYAPLSERISVLDRNIILIDEGIQVGSQLAAVITSLRKAQPLKIVVATPVASQSAVKRIKPLVDHLLVFEVISDDQRYSDSYQHYDLIGDADVTRILSEAHKLQPYMLSKTAERFGDFGVITPSNFPPDMV